MTATAFFYFGKKSLLIKKKKKSRRKSFLSTFVTQKKNGATHFGSVSLVEALPPVPFHHFPHSISSEFSLNIKTKTSFVGSHEVD